LNILLPYDLTTTGMKNPYLFMLVRELVKNKNITTVQHGYGWLYECLKPDIIHLHWPELLVKSKLSDMSRVDLLKDDHFNDLIHALKTKKAGGAKIILTVHNEMPHKGDSDRFQQLYESVFGLCDGIIHMGKTSKKITDQRYHAATEGKPFFIIPHGNYKIFDNSISRDVCRKKLSVNPQDKLLLAFGAIRSAKELNFGIRAFKEASVSQSIFLMAGKLPHPYKSQPVHFKTRKNLYVNMFSRRIRTVEKVIEPNEVQIYLNAADLLFIPRFNTLNSGNVALGFTFGKVVVGPDYGVIGEDLKKCGNPVFDPYRIETVAAAIREGFILAQSGHGEKNRDYAETEMGWDMIADKTVNAYQTVLNR
jgi:beta-1,4-mannosyltransferase